MESSKERLVVYDASQLYAWNPQFLASSDADAFAGAESLAAFADLRRIN